MFCPRCGDEGKSDQTSYCSNCGFQTSQIEAFLDTPIKTRKKRSRLRRGLMQSYILFASVVGIFVVGGLLQPLLRTSTRWFVISSLILFLLGVFRLAYAVLFESEFLGRHEDRLESRNTESPNPKQIDGQRYISVNDLFHSPGATTNELKEPVQTVTDSTTKRLRVDEE